jgi:hypothetical protein
MRLSIALGALAGGLTLGWAVLAEAADQAPPPAAPIFYCPSAPPAHAAPAAGAARNGAPAPQSCPAVVSHHAVADGHRHEVVRHEVVRREPMRREPVRVIVRREAPNEDVSASQAFIYRYEEARRGLNADAADEAWRHESPADRRVHERVYAEAPPAPMPPRPCPDRAVDHCQPGPGHDAYRSHVFIEPPPPAPPPVVVRAQPQAPAPVYVQVAPTPPAQVYVRMAPAAPPQVYVEREHAPQAPPAYYYEQRQGCPDEARDHCPLAEEQPDRWHERDYAQAPPQHRELPPPPALVEREQYAEHPAYVERRQAYVEHPAYAERRQQYVEHPAYAERDQGVTADGRAYAYERRESEQSSGWRYSDDNGQVRSEHWSDGDGHRDDGRHPDACPNSCDAGASGGSAYQTGEWRDGSYGAVSAYSGRDSYGYLVWPGKSQ